MEKRVEYLHPLPCYNVTEVITNFIEKQKKIYKTIKVGITGRNPQERFDEHINDDPTWERMVVVYTTKSEEYANKIEKYCIHEFPELKNKWIGYSDLHEFGYDYVYFLLKDIGIAFKMGVEIGDKMK